MNRVLVVGEDALCCEFGVRLLTHVLPHWELASPPVPYGGITKLLARIDALVEQSDHVQPVICIADTDGRCPAELINMWRPARAGSSFIFRLAHAETESWILADRMGFSQKFGIPLAKIPHVSDDLVDPKQLLINISIRSKFRWVRTEVVSEFNLGKRGSGYNVHLCEFVRNDWDLMSARKVSESLNRACLALEKFGEGGS